MHDAALAFEQPGDLVWRSGGQREPEQVVDIFEIVAREFCVHREAIELQRHRQGTPDSCARSACARHEVDVVGFVAAHEQVCGRIRAALQIEFVAFVAAGALAQQSRRLAGIVDGDRVDAQFQIRVERLVTHAQLALMDTQFAELPGATRFSPLWRDRIASWLRLQHCARARDAVARRRDAARAARRAATARTELPAAACRHAPCPATSTIRRLASDSWCDSTITIDPRSTRRSPWILKGRPSAWLTRRSTGPLNQFQSNSISSAASPSATTIRTMRHAFTRCEVRVGGAASFMWWSVAI